MCFNRQVLAVPCMVAILSCKQLVLILENVCTCELDLDGDVHAFANETL